MRDAREKKNTCTASTIVSQMSSAEDTAVCTTMWVLEINCFRRLTTDPLRVTKRILSRPCLPLAEGHEGLAPFLALRMLIDYPGGKRYKEKNCKFVKSHQSIVIY